MKVSVFCVLIFFLAIILYSQQPTDR